ncbi:MAG: sigma-70 family RNA polymerase sigma factor [Alphaproteobacteria bacterium]
MLSPNDPSGLETALQPEAMPVTPASPSDLLVAVARNRDRAAFRQLFEHYAPRVKGYLRRQGCPDGVAEELAQEAMLRVWHKANQFDPAKASPATWIFTIARNLRIDALRREGRPEPDREAAMATALPEPQPDWMVEAEERRRNVQAALADLPAEQADIVRLSFFEDRSHSEIAAALDLPLGTVKSRLRLAFARIRKALGASE